MSKGSPKEDLYSTIWPEGAPIRNIRCRHCTVKNRVDVGRAVLKSVGCVCGKCGEELFLKSTDKLVNISPKAYQHPLDRKTLMTLESIPGMSLLMKWFLNEIGEKPLRYQYLASSIRVSDEQFPELLALLGVAQNRLDIEKTPTVFLTQSPILNASTFGAEEPTIIVHSGILDHLDDPTAVSVLGHELGHIHSDHSVYKLLASVLIQSGVMFGAISKLLTTPIQLGLQKWSRCAELTADRAGLLSCGDVHASMDVLLRLAGGRSYGVYERTNLKIGPFVSQARELAKSENENWLDGIVANWMNAYRSHPYAAWRMLHLLQWIEHGNYLDIISGNYKVGLNLNPKLESESL